MFTFQSSVIFFCCLSVIKGWDNDEFELFDLVEEVNQNFYEIFGLTAGASSAEIRKAYRKLSMQMHPDKNKEEGAEDKFRQINAVYEILKDEKRRKQYDHVLEFGLPDWRQPVYYYRKVRKLGLLEISLMLSLIFTVGHFLIIWVAYFERKFEVEEVFKSRKKKDKKSRRNKATASNDDEEDVLQEILQTLPRPKFRDLLPLKCLRGLMGLCKGSVCALMKIIESRRAALETEEDTAESEDEQASTKTRRKRVDLHLEKTPEMAAYEAPVVYTAVNQNTSSASESKTDCQDAENRPWTSEDDHLLAKAVAKFPGGTTQRWEKIANMLNRPQSVVIKKAKAIQSDYNRIVDTSAQGITGTADNFSKSKKVQDLENAEISTRAQDLMPETMTRRRVRPTKVEKTVDRTLMIATQVPNSDTKSETLQNKNTGNLGTKEGKDLSNTINSQSSSKLVVENNTKASLKVDNSQLSGDVWSQNQQKIFEWSLTQYPKGTADRWDRIAGEIPGKTKEDCIARFKLLASIVQKKKQAAQQ